MNGTVKERNDIGRKRTERYNERNGIDRKTKTAAGYLALAELSSGRCFDNNILFCSVPESVHPSE